MKRHDERSLGSRTVKTRQATSFFSIGRLRHKQHICKLYGDLSREPRQNQARTRICQLAESRNDGREFLNILWSAHPCSSFIGRRQDDATVLQMNGATENLRLSGWLSAAGGHRGRRWMQIYRRLHVRALTTRLVLRQRAVSSYVRAGNEIRLITTTKHEPLPTRDVATVATLYPHSKSRAHRNQWWAIINFRKLKLKV